LWLSPLIEGIKCREIMECKIQQRKLIYNIQTILLQNWDPIGVSNNPNLKDEYDGYIGQVIQILSKNASVEEIVNILIKFERDMGVCSELKVLYDVALKLKNVESIL